MSLMNALQTRSRRTDTVPDKLNELTPAFVAMFNSKIAPRLLSRLSRDHLGDTGDHRCDLLPRDRGRYRTWTGARGERSSATCDDRGPLNVW